MNNLKTAYVVINDEYIDAVCDNESDAAEMCLSLIEEDMYPALLRQRRVFQGR